METSSLVREIQDKQTQVTRRLAQVQSQLYSLEDEYLDMTTLRGNVSRGWEGYLDFKSRSSSSAVLKRDPRKAKASERIFSFSSVSAPIPKSDLEKDEDVLTTVHWAKEYANHITASVSEIGREGAEKSTDGSKINGGTTQGASSNAKASGVASASKRVKRE
jgi:hypothetical protein